MAGRLAGKLLTPSRLVNLGEGVVAVVVVGERGPEFDLLMRTRLGRQCQER